MKKEKTIQEMINDFKQNPEIINCSFEVEGEPVPLARPRIRRFGGFYNPSATKENDFRKKTLNALSQEMKDKLNKLITNEKAVYYVSINLDFYVKIQSSSSKAEKALKEAGIILPDVRNGDIDNYIKFVLDSLHEVFYTDDKCVICIKSTKKYADKPKTRADVQIDVIRQ